MGFFEKAFDGHVALPSTSELLKAFADLGPGFWMTLIGGGLWLVILNVSLHAIDRRDLFTGFTYMLFMLASGVMLVIALPAKLLHGTDLTAAQLVLMLVLIITSAMRWYLRPRAAMRLLVDSNPTQNQKEKP